MTTSITNFTLRAPIDVVPAGAVGQLKQLDSHHVAMFFVGDYPDLVFDIHDTEPEVWAAISPLSNPSMVDPPRRIYGLLKIAAVIAIAYTLGLATDTPTFIGSAKATAVEYVVDYIW